MKTDLFQSCGHCWIFQICWHTECSTFTASSFRIWNSSAGILSPSLALFIMMLPKAHLTSDTRITDSRWVITPSWFYEPVFMSFTRKIVYCIKGVYHILLTSNFIVFIFIFLLFLTNESTYCLTGKKDLSQSDLGVW